MMITCQVSTYNIQHPQVASSQCVTTAEGVVVAVLLRPVYGRAARYTVLAEVAESLRAITSLPICVSDDMAVYQAIAHGDSVSFAEVAKRRGSYLSEGNSDGG